MTKSLKKTDAAPKAAAKPRKPAVKRTAAVAKVTPISNSREAKVTPISVSHEQVAELAHRFWNERGRAHGHHEEDWFRAEQLLRAKAS